MSHEGSKNLPLSQRNSASTSRPNTVNPSTVSAYDDENKALFLLFILDLSMESRYTLERAQIDINWTIVTRRGRSIGYAAASNSYSQGLQIESDVWKHKRVVCADLGWRVVWRGRTMKNIDVIHLRAQGCDGCWGHCES